MSRRERRKRLNARARRALVWQGSSYEATIRALNPLLNYEMKAPDATELNEGTQGATLNGTISDMGAQNLASIGGSPGSHLLDADLSQILTPNDASINALSAFTYMVIVLPFSRGEGNLGSFLNWSTSGLEDQWLQLSATAMQYVRRATTTDAKSVGTYATDLIAERQVHWVTFDDNGDRKARLFRFTEANGFEEASYSTQDAAVDALLAHNAAARWFRSGGGTLTFDGLSSDGLIFGKVLSELQMETASRAALAVSWDSYIQKQQNILGADGIGIWPLIVQAGAIVYDYSGKEHNGAISGGVTLGVAGVGDNLPQMTFDGVDGIVNVYSAALAAAFNTAEGAMGISLDGLAVGGTVMRINADGNNEVIISLPSATTVTLAYAANSVRQSRTVTIGAGQAQVGISWSVANDRVRVFLNGVQEGADIAGIDTWIGALNASRCLIGGATTVPTGLSNIDGGRGWLASRELSIGEMGAMGSITA